MREVPSRHLHKQTDLLLCKHKWQDAKQAPPQSRWSLTYHRLVWILRQEDLRKLCHEAISEVIPINVSAELPCLIRLWDDISYIKPMSWGPPGQGLVLAEDQPIKALTIQRLSRGFFWPESMGFINTAALTRFMSTTNNIFKLCSASVHRT